MKEQGPIGQDRLTIQPAPPKLEVGRTIFMAEGREAPRPPINPVERKTPAIDAGLPIRPEVSGGETSGKRLKQSIALARESWTNLYGRDLASLPFDERQSVEAAIALGYGPSHITGKGADAPAAKEVIRNSLLTQSERMVKAEELLHRGLSVKEKEALQRAHITGAGVYSNTEAQLAEKVRILKNEGFSKEEIRILIEAGLAAAPIPPGTYTDPRLVNIVDELNTDITVNGVGRPLPQEYLEGQINRVRNLLDQGVANTAEATTLLGQLRTWAQETQAAIRTAQEESNSRGYFSQRETRAILTDPDERNRIFEGIFAGVDATPGKAFQLGLEPQGRHDNFFNLLDDVEVRDAAGTLITNPDGTAVMGREEEVSARRQQLRQEFSGRAEVRRILHDANYSATGGGDVNGFAQSMSTFQSEYIDLIFQDPLVATALHMFEQAFQQTKADNNGMLPYEELAWNYKEDEGRGSSKLEDKVEKLMRQEMAMGVAQNVPEWRLRRAIILARGFGVASLRFPEIAAQARLPEETTFASSEDRASRMGSIYGEAIARYLDPLEHLIEKFGIGKEDRAFLYFFLTGDKTHFETREQLEKALKMASHLTGKDKRLIDIVNIFRIGGGFSNSSWRPVMAMKGLTPEQRRRFGIGILEGRVSGDVDDVIRERVRAEFAGRPGNNDDEINKRIEELTKGKNKKVKTDMVYERRIAMWKDALKANPLRVMWQWEEKEPGKRIQFLREAIGMPGMPEDDAKRLLSEIEQNLMIVQEDTVRRLAAPKFLADGVMLNPDHLEYDDDRNAPDMLRLDLIADPAKREQVRLYVKKIRDEAEIRRLEYKDKKGNARSFIESLFDKDDVQGSPFPFVIGFEDIPFSDFNFINTGGRGFARRINDYANSVKAANELMNLITIIPTTHNIRPLIDSLVKIKNSVAEYDKDIAMEVVPYLARGIIKFYDKDLAARLPLGIGSLTAMLSDSSYAQEQYGRAAMAWDEGDKFNFTRQLLHNGLVSKKELAKIRKDVGATPAHAGVDIVRTYGQLALLLLLYSFAKSVASDK